MMSVKLHDRADASLLSHLGAPVQQRLREIAVPAMPMQSLRRTGMRPYGFNGAPLATVSGITPGLPFWYELNVFTTVVETYVCDVRLFHKTDAPDLFRVVEQDDFEDALAWFERYDPAHDVRPGPALTDAKSNAARAIECARLQLELAAVVDHYRIVVGQLLTALAPR